MQAFTENFNSFLTVTGSEFKIPKYQRSYVWSISKCKRFYNDITKVIKNTHPNHFFGTIIIRPTPPDGTTYEIIDGQQRLTTISLFLLAVKNVIIQNKSKYPEYNNPNSDTPVSLINTYLVKQPGSTRLRLKSESSNFNIYNSLYQDPDLDKRTLTDKRSTLCTNYKYFCEIILNDLKAPGSQLSAHDYTLDQIIRAFPKLTFAKVVLDSGDDAQVIFDCMNSTGEALTAGDNIRNFLLMGDDQFYDSWKSIMENTCIASTSDQGNDVTEFIRTWLRYKLSSKVIKKESYETFKDYIHKHYQLDPKNTLNNQINHSKIFEELTNASAIYKVIINGSNSHNLGCSGDAQEESEFDQILKRLNYLNIKQYHTFALSLLSDCRNNLISFHEVLQVFRYLESYIFRGIVCHYRANKYESVFPQLHKKVREYQDTHTSTSYLDAFLNLLISSEMVNKGIAFPDDETFRQELAKRSYVEGNNKSIKYALDRINIRLTSQTTNAPNELNIDSKLFNNSISIEHIFPQKPVDKWNEYLGEDYAATSKLLHQIGNLTLTGYNREYSNLTFDDKKNLEEGGFNVSELALNRPRPNQNINGYTPVANYDKWGSQQITERTNQLTQLSLDIWQYPQDIHANVIVSLRSSLTLNDDFTNKHPTSVHIEIPNGSQILSDNFKVNNFADCFKKIIRFLDKHPEYHMERIISDEDEISIRSYLNINEDGTLTISAPSNNEQKIRTLRRIFDYYEIDYTEDEPVIIYTDDDAVIDQRLTLNDSINSFINKEIRSIHIELPNNTTTDIDVENQPDWFSSILEALDKSHDYNLSQLIRDQSQAFTEGIISVGIFGLMINPPARIEEKIKFLKKVFDYFRIDYTEDDPIIFYLD